MSKALSASKSRRKVAGNGPTPAAPGELMRSPADRRGAGVGMYMGIEIGGSKLQVAVGSRSQPVQACWRWLVDRRNGSVGIRAQLEASLPGIVKQYSPAAVGVGFGGPVDHRTGRIGKSYHIEGWAGFELGEWLRDLTKLPVAVDNDGNVAALGEAESGAGKQRNPVFYVTLGSGVGGGLVADGRIYHGAAPGESEFGHVLLDRSGVELESRCSGWAVDAKIRDAIAADAGSVLATLAGQTAAEGCEASFLTAALARRDPVAEQILQETCDDLAFGLSHVVHLFHPEIVVLGGGLSLIGEALRAKVARCLRTFVMDAFVPGPQVALAMHGEHAVPVGAIILAAGSGERTAGDIPWPNPEVRNRSSASVGAAIARS